VVLALSVRCGYFETGDQRQTKIDRAEYARTPGREMCLARSLPSHRRCLASPAIRPVDIPPKPVGYASRPVRGGRGDSRHLFL